MRDALLEMIGTASQRRRIDGTGGRTTNNFKGILTRRPSVLTEQGQDGLQYTDLVSGARATTSQKQGSFLRLGHDGRVTAGSLPIYRFELLWPACDGVSDGVSDDLL